MYENLIQERTERRNSDHFEVERHLSPEALSFSVSDAAVQTELCKTQNEIKEKSVSDDKNRKLCSLLPFQAFGVLSYSNYYVKALTFLKIS